MMYKRISTTLVVGVALFAWVALPAAFAVEPLATMFTYQGQLKQNGAPVHVNCDFEFSVWDAPSGGIQRGPTITTPIILVENGLFSYDLDFNTSVFDGSDRWVEVGVRCPALLGNFTPLTPRHAITATPYAMKVRGVDGSSLDAEDGDPVNAVRVDSTGRTRIEKGGFTVFDDVGQGINLTSDQISLNEGTSEDPAYRYSAVDDSHRFYTNGAERMRINADGDVGIGQQNPQTTLHLGGLAGVDGLIFPDGTLQTTASTGSGSLWTFDQPGRISYDGEVTIGTTNTTASLKVFTEEGPAISALVSGEVGDGIAVSTVGVGSRAISATASGEESYGLDVSATNTEGIAISAVARGINGTGIHVLSTGANGATIKANARTDTQVAIEANATGTATLNDYPLPNTAGKFYALGTDGVGIFGRTDGSSGYGVHGKAEGSGGKGVFGEATIGSGTGVHGFNSSSTGSAIAVRGHTNSSNGYSGYFTGGRNYFAGRVGLGELNPAAKLHIGGNAGVDGIMFPDGTLQTTAAIGGGGDSLWSESVSDIFYTAGNVGIGTSNPADRLHVVGDTWLQGNVTIGDTSVANAMLGLTASGLYGIKGDTANGIGAGIAGEATNAAGFAYGVYGNTIGRGAGVYGHGAKTGVEGASTAADGVGVHGHISTTGSGVYGSTTSSGVNYGVRGVSASTSGYGGYFVNTSSDGTALYATSAGARTGDATLQVHNTQPVEGMAAYITSVGSFATMHAKNDGIGEVLWLSKNNAEGEFIVAHNEVTGRRVFSVDQDGWTKVSVLEITGGADLSEQFDIAGGGAEVRPGMVVVIDEDHPGKLAVARSPYDTKVAGIISGAGGVKPGMLMSQHDSMADGKHPVALTGRVWTWCDATDGAIKPGDLLTTSKKLGHAMKVTDHTKAQGAIIGKAMTKLEKDKGLVLVLVSLQ